MAAEGWVIITRDSRTEDEPAEIGAVRAYGAGRWLWVAPTRDLRAERSCS